MPIRAHSKSKSSKNYGKGRPRWQKRINWRWLAVSIGLLVVVGAAVLPKCTLCDVLAELGSATGLGPRLVHTNGALGKIQAHDSVVWDVAFSRDGSMLATASDDHTVRLWRMDTHDMLQEFSHPGVVYKVAMSPLGGLMASTSWDGAVRVWQIETGALATGILYGDSLFSNLVFSPDGTLLACGNMDGLIYVWHVKDGNLLRSLKAGDSEIRSVAFSPDGAMLASTDADSSIILWQVENGAVLHRFSKGIDVFRAYFTGEDTVIALGNDDVGMWLREWALPEGAVVNAWEKPKERAYDAAYSPVSNTVAISAGNIDILQVDSGKRLAVLVGPGLTGASTLAYSPDGQTIAVGTTDGSVWLWPAQP